VKESRAEAIVTVEGFFVTSPSSEEDERHDECVNAAYEIASEIGSALASCGTSAGHGRVTVEIDGVQGASDEVPA
jgi:hypothetical protein